MRTSIENLHRRRESARKSFLVYMADFLGFTKEEAESIEKYYVKHRLVKYDPHSGQFTVPHGAFLDKEVMARAIVFARHTSTTPILDSRIKDGSIFLDEEMVYVVICPDGTEFALGAYGDEKDIEEYLKLGPTYD